MEFELQGSQLPESVWVRAGSYSEFENRTMHLDFDYIEVIRVITYAFDKQLGDLLDVESFFELQDRMSDCPYDKGLLQAVITQLLADCSVSQLLAIDWCAIEIFDETQLFDHHSLASLDWRERTLLLIDLLIDGDYRDFKFGLKTYYVRGL